MKRTIEYKKIALAFSMIAIIIWAILGTGTSLAWFSDTTPELKNVFHFADFDLVVSQRQEDGTYKEIDSETELFDDEALYEPGYVQVIHLMIENKGDVVFDFESAVSVTAFTTPTNVYGDEFKLQEYLKFGLISDTNENVILNKTADRNAAEQIANMPLNSYSTDVCALDPNEKLFMALVVRMPKEVKNEANYRGDTIPRVELGVIFNASQQHN